MKSSAANRRRLTVWTRSAGCAAACVIALLPVDLAAQNPIVTAIRGRVLDERTEQPIPHVHIEYMDGSTRIRASAMSQEDGNFILSGVPSGSFRLRATRLGYQKVITPYWRVQRGEVLTVVVRVSPDALLLPALEITAKSRATSPVLEGFHRRAEQKLGGVFITREEIEARAPFRITDLLTVVPGVVIENAGGENRRVRFGRTLLGPGGGLCPVQIFVDGVLATRNRRIDVSPDELASPGALEGIEIHRGLSTLPPEFVTPEARCGVIALWTKRGD